MSNISSYVDIHFDVDLIEAAKAQVEFLQLVDKQANLYEGPLVKQAIYRYTNYDCKFTNIDIKFSVKQNDIQKSFE